jgi:hypothetical protein
MIDPQRVTVVNLMEATTQKNPMQIPRVHHPMKKATSRLTMTERNRKQNRLEWGGYYMIVPTPILTKATTKDRVSFQATTTTMIPYRLLGGRALEPLVEQ